jgi:hypothetical protein
LKAAPGGIGISYFTPGRITASINKFNLLINVAVYLFSTATVGGTGRGAL